MLYVALRLKKPMILSLLVDGSNGKQRHVKVYWLNGSASTGVSELDSDWAKLDFIVLYGIDNIITLICNHRKRTAHRVISDIVVYLNFVLQNGSHIYSHEESAS